MAEPPVPATTPLDPAPAISTLPTIPLGAEPLADGPFAHLTNASRLLAPGNTSASVSVWRDHEPVFRSAAGVTVDGGQLTPDSPMVVASVSKLFTALTVSRLAEDGHIDVGAPVPWDRLGLPHAPEWNDVTVRELLDHTSGMPKAQNSWLNEPGSCAIPLAEALAFPPRIQRGEWVYSNGNYCALGLLIEAVTGAGFDAAADLTLFAPIGVDGPHLSTTGALPGDAPHARGFERLERLGGAGTWVASTDDVARVLDSVTVHDLATLQYPGVMSDQYGWGHTGTIDGAKACAWVIEGGRTVVVAVVAGDRPSAGGKVCDIVVPALAADLGIWDGVPFRLPA